MKLFILIISSVLVLLFTSCSKDPKKLNYLQNSEIISHLDENSSIPYQSYVEKALVKRVKAFTLYNDLSSKEYLSGKDLDSLHSLIADYLDTREETNYYMAAYRYIVKDGDTQYSKKIQFELVMISLSAMLIQYDNYNLVYKKYQGDDTLRGIVNSSDSAYGISEDVLQDITDEYNSQQNLRAVSAMIHYYQKGIGDYKEEKDDFFIYLQMLVENSISYQNGLREDPSLLDSLTSSYDTILDYIDSIWSDIFGSVSEEIGNTAGLVEVRKGLFYGDKDASANVEMTLQIGDILLDKTPFRLTDKLIPGFWGHVAVYIGNEEELRTLGLWDDPVVVPYHEKISAGNTIEGALRDGVQLVSIDEFLNVDDIAIMHEKEESTEDLKKRILLLFRQLGKEYDFEYDAQNSEKLVCSELVYITSVNIDWELENLAGITTISPDNIAIKSTEENSSYTLPLLYYDGEEVFDDRVLKMEEILKG